MGNKSFCKPLGSGGDLRLRVTIRTRKGRVVEFLVQLELYAGDGWMPVVRYDNSHGFPHRDVLDAKGHELEKTPLKLGTLAECLEYAEQDLSDRFEWYVERFERMRRPS